jgi:hypothetical protein
MAKNKNKNQKQTQAVSTKKTGPKVSARPVSRKYKLLARKDRSEYDRLDSLFQSLRWRTRIIDRPQNAQEKVLRDKYLKDNDVESRAAQLLNQYGEAGLQRAAAIQAVKTDKIDLLLNKWNPRLSEFKRVQEAMKRGRMGELLKDGKL